MINRINELQEKALEKISQCKNLNELNEAKAESLGKKSPVQEIMSKMREFSVEENALQLCCSQMAIACFQLNQFKK